ncbi:MAG: hypothetical protein HYZ28_16725 [Myxococcales bacterium]|nr:hypothetical protein [Myxococcales bacterium]
MSTAPAPLPESVPIQLVIDRRVCFGELCFSDDALLFICLLDESLTAQAVGKAVSSNFGLVGGLIGGAVSAAQAHSRDKKLAELKEQQRQMALEQRFSMHPLSRSIARSDIRGFVNSTWSGTHLDTSEGKLVLQALGPEAAGALARWCTERGIPVRLPKKWSRRTKLIIGLSPVALVVLYALAAVPFALKMSSNFARAKEAYQAVIRHAKPAHEQLAQPLGADLESACAGVLAGAGARELVGYVGELPGEAGKAIGTGYQGFPRLAVVYSFDGKLDVGSRELPSWIPNSSFTGSWVSVMTEVPSDWDRKLANVYPLPHLEGVRYVAVARAHRAVLPKESYAAAAQPGRAELSVQVVSLGDGKTVCEGDVAVSWPPASADKGRYRSPREATADGIPLGALLGLCKTVKPELCSAIAGHVERAAPEAPVAAALAAPAPVVAKQGVAPKGKKGPLKKTTKRTRR